MFSEQTIRLIVWAIVVFITLRTLLGSAIMLRDRLQGLLMEYIKKQQIESQKRKRITELREKIRAKKTTAEVVVAMKEKKVAADVIALTNEKKAA